MESVMSLFANPAVLTAIFIGASVIVLVYILKLLKTEENTQEKQKNGKSSVAQSEKKKDTSGKLLKKKNSENRWTGRSEKGYSHPWLLTSLKGHTGEILDIDFSSNGKYLASCGNDRAVFLWDTKDLTQKDHKSLRINIEFDHPTFVKWSPDSKAFIIHRYNENTVEVYKVEKKKDGWLGTTTKALTFPKSQDEDVIGMGIASNGKFIMTCSNKTNMIIWDLKGQILAHVDTYLMSTTCAKISPCGRYVVASGFAPDAKVWEVTFSKTNEFQEVKRVFELTGHTSGVYDVAFDVDTSHMATVSKDGTWRLYDTKIDYKRGEDPRLKISGKYEQSSGHALIALSPNSEVIAIATSNYLAFYSTLTGKLDFTIDNIYTGNITVLMFDSTGKYVVTSGDRQIRVFHNVTGYKCNITTSNEKLKENITSATRERLEKLIMDSENFLATIEKN